MTRLQLRSNWLDLFHLFLPSNCKACSIGLQRGETFICINCLIDLPRTNYQDQPNNPIEKILWGRVHVQHALSWLHFSKGGMVQQLLHELKYNGQQDLGVFLGELMAQDLRNSRILKDIDCIIPIPLHKSKQAKRGYNQSVCIANGIAKVIHAPIDSTSVIRRIANPTQTKRSRMSRWENVSDIMEVMEEEALMGKHVLLVDDVITTGSTIEAMTSVMESIPKIKISVLALCWASDI